MDEETASNVEEQMEGESEISTKKPRHRKKQLYQDIKKQMEFYFSDANLTKDRFLGKLMQDDPNIDIAVFIQFNKIRAMTTDIRDIANALRKSELLAVTEDGAKVFRKTSFMPKDNVDDCTIYVEQLPPDAQHDWLIDVFSAYGKVTYVSIPKYRSSGKIKGFAFVEFQTPEDANKTLEAFGAMGCRLSTQIAPEKLCSIATFEPDEGKIEETTEKEINEDETNQSLDSSPKKKKKRKKVKLETSEETNTEENKTIEQEGDSETISPSKMRKRKKTQEEAEESDAESGQGQTEDNEETPPKKKKKRKSESIEHEVKEGSEETKTSGDISNIHSSDVPQDQPEKKKKKKRRSEESEERCDNAFNIEADNIESHSERRKQKRGRDSGEELEENKIISSEDIESHSEEKKKKRGSTQDEEQTPDDDDGVKTQDVESKASENEDVTMEGEEEMVEKEGKKRRKRKKKHKREKQDVEASRLQILSKREWKRLRNKYLDLQKEKMKSLKCSLNKNKWNRNAGGFRTPYPNGNAQEKEEHGEESTEAPKQEVDKKPRISFTPGVIVHITFDEPIMDERKFKAEARTLPDVQYVDVMKGANEAFIRCTTSSAADNFVTNAPWQQTVILKGEEEKNYWDKIIQDRQHKFSSNIRAKQRGRDKILRRAERELGKHIKFDD